MSHAFKFFLYRFLNREHNKFEQVAFKAACHLFCGVFSIPKAIKHVMLEEIEKHEWKKVLRRLSWLGARKTRGLLSFSDDYFDFSVGLTTSAALKAYDYIERCAGDDFLKQITLAQLASAVLESQVPPGHACELTTLKNNEYDELYTRHVGAANSFLTELKRGQMHSNEAHNGKSLNDAEMHQDQAKGRSQGTNLMHKYGYTVFKQVLDISSHADVPVFVISGTFLGLIREKNFIPHDFDIDLGVMQDEYSEELIRTVDAHQDFRVSEPDFPCFREVDADGAVTYRRERIPALVKIYHKNGVQVDLFVHFDEGSIVWHGSSLHRWDNKKFDLIERDFLGEAVLSPANHDEYLTENYGDWRTPVKKFNCNVGTPNITLSNSCKTRCYFLKKDYFSLDDPVY